MNPVQTRLPLSRSVRRHVLDALNLDAEVHDARGEVVRLLTDGRERACAVRLRHRRELSRNFICLGKHNRVHGNAGMMPCREVSRIPRSLLCSFFVTPAKAGDQS